MMNEWIISSSLLIAAVLIGRRLLRGRISLRLQYALWAVVLIRLLLPFQLFSSRIGAGSIAQDMDISEPVRQVYVSAREDDYEREYDVAYSRVVAGYQASGQTYEPIVVEREAAAQAMETIELDLNKLLYGAWFAGMIVMTAVIAACNIHLGLHLKRRRWELPVSDSLLPVYITEAVPTPCIFGLFHPAIYLTPEAAKEGSVRDHVLAHELTHYRHWDHIWSVLRSLCLILHWYNPLVWIAAKVSRADAELACDEGALACLGEEHRADYGRTLIGLTCPDNGSSMFVTATTMTGSAGSIRERIRLLMKRPRNTVLTLIAVVLVGTIIVGCSFAGAPETTEPGADGDLSDHEETLTLSDDLSASDFVNADSVLVFPGTEWGMTEAALLEALDIQEYGIFSGMRGFHLPKTTFWGYPVGMAFYFDHYSTDAEWGLSNVVVKFEEEADFNAVRTMLIEQLGSPDFQTSGVSFDCWRSDVRTEELVSPEAYAQYQESRTVSLTENNLYADGAASTISCYGPGNSNENAIYFEGWLTQALQIEAALNPGYDVNYFDDLLNPGLYRSEADWYPLALTSYYDSPAGIDLFQLFYNGIPGADNTLPPDELAFLEDQPGYEPDFDLDRIPAREMDRVLTEYFGITLDETAQIGLANFIYNPQSGCYYHSHTDTNLSFRTVYAVEELPDGNWRVLYTDKYFGDSEVILRQQDGKWQIVSNLLVWDESADPAAAALAGFSEPSNLEALTRLWNGWTGFSENEFVPAFTPEIMDCVPVSNDTVMVYYLRPGEQQVYAAEMMPHEDGWAVTANSLVISKTDDARDLTAGEMEQVSTAFKPDIYDEERGEGIANPLACLVNDYYDDVTKLDRSELLAYFPGSTGATEREFKLLKEKYPDFFEGWTWENMPIPIHCYGSKTINAVLNRYADIRWEDLPWDEDLHYLEQTHCFYNYTSDSGLYGFPCTGGWVTDDGAVLLSNHSALYMTERDGDYYIKAHLPAIVAQVSPIAHTTPEEEITGTLEAFFLAYEENVNLYADHNYDHLTVLTADRDRTVSYQGKTVSFSDFYGNIEYLRGKEAYWKHVRKDQGIVESTFQVTTYVDDIRYDGDVAVAQVGINLTFYYEGLGAPSGIGEAFEVLLVPADDTWLIADITELNDWFDEEYKNDPDFDLDAMIASYIP